jgi:hypothetical protein
MPTVAISRITIESFAFGLSYTSQQVQINLNLSSRFSSITTKLGHALAQVVGALRYNRKVADSIPDYVTGIFH